MGGNSSAQAGGNGTAARQKAEETGSSLPARLSHTYTSAGQHRLSFMLKAVSDAAEEAGAADHGASLGQVGTLVSVGEGLPEIAPGTVLGQVPFNATGELPIALPTGDCDPEGGEEFPWTFEDKLNGTS